MAKAKYTAICLVDHEHVTPADTLLIKLGDVVISTIPVPEVRTQYHKGQKTNFRKKSDFVQFLAHNVGRWTPTS